MIMMTDLKWTLRPVWEPPILKTEVENLIQHIKKGKAPGKDNITIKEIKMH